MSISEICENLETYFQKVEKSIIQIENSSNRIIALQNNSIIDYWHSVNQIFTEYLELRDTTKFQDILPGREFGWRYIKLAKRYSSLLNEQIK